MKVGMIGVTDDCAISVDQTVYITLQCITENEYGETGHSKANCSLDFPQKHYVKTVKSSLLILMASILQK